MPPHHPVALFCKQNKELISTLPPSQNLKDSPPPSPRIYLNSSCEKFSTGKPHSSFLCKDLTRFYVYKKKYIYNYPRFKYISFSLTNLSSFTRVFFSFRKKIKRPSEEKTICPKWRKLNTFILWYFIILSSEPQSILSFFLEIHRAQSYHFTFLNIFIWFIFVIIVLIFALL